ncbi:MAG: hypothetical protein IPJ17_02500 [Holophagales bacterium]|nr:MAG: hypothetical protein IPJ17_02500 [Holophagales bacterium]
MNVSELLVARREAILDRATESLSRAHLPSYEAVGVDRSRARLEKLFDLATDAVARRNLTDLLHYVEGIAQGRFEAGFALPEVQMAFNVLEEAIWSTVVAEIPPIGLGEAFGLVGTALGAGKDRLAATYVELASQAKAPSLDLRALFNGTAAG